MAGRRLTIHVVEDDQSLRRLLSLALRFAGLDTREARDGYEALTQCRPQLQQCIGFVSALTGTESVRWSFMTAHRLRVSGFDGAGRFLALRPSRSSLRRRRRSSATAR